MPKIIAVRPRRRRIVFVSCTNKGAADTSQIQSRKQTQAKSRILSSSNNSKARSPEQKGKGPSLTQGVDEPFLNLPTMASIRTQPGVPKLFTSLPPIRDPLVTETSIVQDETVQRCLPFLAGTEEGKGPFDVNVYGVPYLERRKHVRFLHASLQDLHSGFVAYDASRPWIVYWALTGLSLLGEDVSTYRERYGSH